MEECPNGDIPLPPFNRAHVGAGETDPCGKRPLGEPSLLPERANGVAEESESLIRARSPFRHDVPVEESLERVGNGGAGGDRGTRKPSGGRGALRSSVEPGAQ